MLILVMMTALTLPPPPPPRTTCVPSPPRGPSLMMINSGGRCTAGYDPVLGDNKKAMYCVNTQHQPPMVCQNTGLLPAPTAQPKPTEPKKKTTTAPAKKTTTPPKKQ